jgi:hypothetical protein
MAEDGGKTNPTETKEGGGGRPQNRQHHGHTDKGYNQDGDSQWKTTKRTRARCSQKLRMDTKKGLEAYFGTGKRIPALSKDRNLISMVVQRREGRGDTPRGKSGGKVEPNTEKEGEGDNNNTVRLTLNTNKGTKALRKESACKKEQQNKKPRSGDKGSGGKDSKHRKALWWI